MLRIILLTTSLILYAGCAEISAPAVRKPPVGQAIQSAPGAPVQKTEQPFMFGEAGLPNQFPPAGPVGEILIKQYPAARAAMVLAGPKLDDQNSLFEPLFEHIESHQIAMSAPVQMTYSTELSSSQPAAMAFFYANATIGKTGKDGLVEVIDVPAAEYVSVGVRGAYDLAHLNSALSKLRGWLQTHPRYKVTGSPRYLAYNSPFVPFFLRFGEVQLPVSER